MRVSDVIPHDRPRERLLALGARALSEAELLAILLRTGTRGKGAIALAHELLARFGGLAGLVTAPRSEVLRIPGLGDAKWSQVCAAFELARYAFGGEVRREPVSNPKSCAAYLRARLGGEPLEVFACLFLDARNHVVAYDELSRGTIDFAQVHPRQVARRAIERNAAGVIFAHNHPSGVSAPSDADVAVTWRLRDALRLLDVRVLDHLIVAGERVLSMAELGLV